VGKPTLARACCRSDLINDCIEVDRQLLQLLLPAAVAVSGIAKAMPVGNVSWSSTYKLIQGNVL